MAAAIAHLWFVAAFLPAPGRVCALRSLVRHRDYVDQISGQPRAAYAKSLAADEFEVDQRPDRHHGYDGTADHPGYCGRGTPPSRLSPAARSALSQK